MNNPSINRLIRNVSLRQLQIFETVVRLGGYTRAAEALHLSQPTVSVQIKKLSETMGQPLLEQIGRKVRPTALGQDIYAAATDILNKLVEMGHSADERHDVLKGDLRIAVVTTAKYFMPRLLSSFTKKYPLVTPHLTIANRATVLDRIKSNEDDMLVMGEVPKDMSVQKHPFINNKLVIAASPNHHLSGSRHVSLKQLSKERFIVREPGSGTRQTLERIFEEQGLKIAPYMELSSSEAIKQCVMANLGIALLSHHNMQLELAGRHIVVLQATGFPLIRRWYAIHSNDKKLPLVARTFLDHIKEEGDTILSTGTAYAKSMKVIPIHPI